MVLVTADDSRNMQWRQLLLPTLLILIVRYFVGLAIRVLLRKFGCRSRRRVIVILSGMIVALFMASGLREDRFICINRRAWRKHVRGKTIFTPAVCRRFGRQWGKATALGRGQGQMGSWLILWKLNLCMNV